MRELFSHLKIPAHSKLRLPVATPVTGKVSKDFSGNQLVASWVTAVTSTSAGVARVTDQGQKRLLINSSANNTVTTVADVTILGQSPYHNLDDSSDFQERAAIAHFDGGIPGEFADAFATLQTLSPPGDMWLDRWQRIINDQGLALDRCRPQS